MTLQSAKECPWEPWSSNWRMRTHTRDVIDLAGHQAAGALRAELIVQ